MSKKRRRVCEPTEPEPSRKLSEMLMPDRWRCATMQRRGWRLGQAGVVVDAAHDDAHKRVELGCRSVAELR